MNKYKYRRCLDRKLDNVATSEEIEYIKTYNEVIKYKEKTIFNCVAISMFVVGCILGVIGVL